jgi:ligand-binding sensor domain-containing protein
MKRILFFILLLIGMIADAQQPDLVFHHLTEKEGLSYNLVNGFLKDSRGMLWIATYNGLNKYDGAHFYTYHSGHTNNSLPNNSVHKLAEDKQGNIWGGTDRGVFCLNPVTGKFKNYGTPRETKWPAVHNICCDKQGRIWATNDACLSVFNAAADSFELPPSANGYYPEGRIRKNGFAESPDGKGFWLATITGLQYYSKEEKKFITHENSTDSSLFNGHNAAALCKTSYGHYWYFDNKEKRIIGFDPINKKIKYNIKAESADKPDRVADGATMFEDSKHTLWLCNWRYEIYMIDYRNSNTLVRIKHNKDDPTSIAGDYFWEAMEESDGTLWFGTVAGISKCNRSRLLYKVHHLPAEANTAENPAIGFITENPLDKTWWIATIKNILVHYYPLTGKSEMIVLEKTARNKNKSTPLEINRMLFFKDSMLLFSNTGIWVKRANSNFVPLEFPPPFSNWTIRDAVLYKDRILYGITHKKMMKWDMQTNVMDSIVFKTPFLINGSTANLANPRLIKGKVWMQSSRNWLVQADGNELKPVLLKYQDSSLQDDGYFTDMIKDSKDNLWITKKGTGLILYNPSTNSSKLLKQGDGLVMDHVMAVAEDGSGKIWSGCYYQFSVYNTVLNSFYNFSLPLSPNNYAYVNLLAPLANGNIFGSVAGELVEFYTDRLKTPLVKDKPMISLLTVNGIDTNLKQYDYLQLSPNENSLRIKFGMLTDNVAMPYDMLYILDGAENNWTVSSINFEANYNSLPPGDYTFKVKALAKDKSWQTKETVLKIHIATPFYKSWWFIGLLIMAVAAALYALYRFRLQKQKEVMELQSKAQLLEKEKTTVMYESLKQQLNPHFLFNSLTSLSGLIQMDPKMAVGFLEQMSKLYRYILKSSENETVPLKDEINFAKLFTSLQKTRFSKGLEVNINIDEEYLHYKIAPVTLQNMVENAIKHNIIDASAPLVIDIFVDNEYLVVKNNLQKKNMVETSNKQGLESLKSLYRFLSERPIVIEEDEKYFAIKIPLI